IGLRVRCPARIRFGTLFVRFFAVPAAARWTRRAHLPETLGDVGGGGTRPGGRARGPAEKGAGEAMGRCSGGRAHRLVRLVREACCVGAWSTLVAVALLVSESPRAEAQVSAEQYRPAPLST